MNNYETTNNDISVWYQPTNSTIYFTQLHANNQTLIAIPLVVTLVYIALHRLKIYKSELVTNL